MATVAALRKNDGGNDQRSALRRAIAEAERARSAVDRHHEAIRRAEEQVATAQEKLAAATTAVESARQRHADALAAAASSGKAAPANGAMRAARLAAADIEDELFAARAAHERLKSSDLQEIRRTAADADSAVAIEADAVLANVVRQQLAKAVQAQREMFEARAVLQTLAVAEDAPLPLARRSVAQSALDALRDSVWKYLNHDITLDQIGVREKFYEIAGAWRRARLGLRTDADIELPDAPPPELLR